MIKNYFTIAWRNITKSRFYAAVNIVGLAMGIAFAFIVGAYVWGELQVNKQLKNADRQFILQSKWKDLNMGIELTSLGPLAKALRENYPNLVANYYRWDGVTSTVSNGEKSFREGLQICDSTMFDMYGFKLLHGNPQKALTDPYNVVITAERAIKYFGKTDVVGQTLSIESFSGSKQSFVVSGVLSNLPKNSATVLNDENHNEVFVSTSNLGFFGRNMDWNTQYIVGYIELQKGVSPRDLELPIRQLIKLNASPQIAANLTPSVVPLTDFYLSGNNGVVKKMIYALSSISFFILAMAIINFINMAMSRSATRMREIGIRKVLGGLRKQLIMQFLFESIILVFFATLFALMIYQLSLPAFNNILSTELPSLNQFPVHFYAIPLLLIVFIGIAAGIYPAIVLSGLRSVDSLKGKLSEVKDNVLLRKSLVAFQFGTATIAFIGAIIISRQINLFFSKDLGYNKDYVVAAQLPRDWSPKGVQKMESLRRQFAELPQVSNVSLSYEVLNGNSAGGASIYRNGTDSTSAVTGQLLMADEYFASTYSIPMAAGEFFGRPGAVADSFKLVINEKQAKALGWRNAAEAVGQQVRFQSGGNIFTIAGVTKDFHFGSMHQDIQPVTFIKVALTNTYRLFSFKLRPGDMSRSLEALQNKWAALLPGAPFDYSFMDDTLQKLYRSEIRLKQAAYAATILSLIIVLLGVLGLVSLAVQKRVKEIGIRKVLGSSVGGIISLFIREFLSVILIAAIVSCPLAYLIMNRWLQAYAFRIDIDAQPFLVAIVLLGVITSATIFLQTIKAALANPVKSLRTE
jgi:putative ABC transport system permease protein